MACPTYAFSNVWTPRTLAILLKCPVQEHLQKCFFAIDYLSKHSQHQSFVAPSLHCQRRFWKIRTSNITDFSFLLSSWDSIFLTLFRNFHLKSRMNILSHAQTGGGNWWGGGITWRWGCCWNTLFHFSNYQQNNNNNVCISDANKQKNWNKTGNQIIGKTSAVRSQDGRLDEFPHFALVYFIGVFSLFSGGDYTYSSFRQQVLGVACPQCLLPGMALL